MPIEAGRGSWIPGTRVPELVNHLMWVLDQELNSSPLVEQRGISLLHGSYTDGGGGEVETDAVHSKVTYS